jgi:hypothetical protein
LKKNSTSKTARANRTATSEEEQMPPGLEFISELKDQTPLQQLAACYPKFAEALKTSEAQQATEGFAGWYWGAGFDLGVALPEWVKAASTMYWQAAGLDFNELKNGSSKEIGKLVGIAENMPETGAPSKIIQTGQSLIKKIKAESGELSATELKKYADARANALKIIQRLAEPPQRVKVLLTIACTWRQIENMETKPQPQNPLLPCPVSRTRCAKRRQSSASVTSRFTGS